MPNMISGASQADAALLVVDATTGEFEAGFAGGGQSREHVLLVRSLGVGTIVVAINKLDMVCRRMSCTRHLDLMDYFTGNRSITLRRDMKKYVQPSNHSLSSPDSHQARRRLYRLRG